VAAVGLALISAVLFGGMSVGLRLGLNRRPDAALATIATVVGATAVALVAAVAEAPSRGVHAGAAWVFLLAGLLQPGIGQLLVTLAIRDVGASRSSCSTSRCGGRSSWAQP
jgi:drug/metabolite transporter (DMT)-like permease